MSKDAVRKVNRVDLFRSLDALSESFRLNALSENLPQITLLWKKSIKQFQRLIDGRSRLPKTVRFQRGIKRDGIISFESGFGSLTTKWELKRSGQIKMKEFLGDKKIGNIDSSFAELLIAALFGKGELGKRKLPNVLPSPLLDSAAEFLRCRLYQKPIRCARKEQWYRLEVEKLGNWTPKKRRTATSK